jgi:hypothetical protein
MTHFFSARTHRSVDPGTPQRPGRIPFCTTWFVLLLLLCAGSARAGSIFSISGQGEMITEGDARLHGMGGTGLALTGSYSGGLINPALMGGLKYTGVTLTARPEALYVKDDDNTNVLTTARIVDFALYLPLGRGLNFSFDLRQLSDARFKAYEEVILFDESYTKAVSRVGGLGMISVGLAKSFGSRVFVGIRGGHVFGRITESVDGDFLDEDFLDSRTSCERFHSGTRLTAGLAVKFSEHLSAGGFLTPAYDVEQDETCISSFAPQSIQERILTFPAAYGLGIAYRSGRRFSGQIDLVSTRWGDFAIDGRQEENFQDVLRLAVGGQYQAYKENSGSYLRRIPLRFGYAYEPWYQKTPDGSSITGHFLTLGFGLPFGRRGALLDAALQLGWRGDLSSAGARETIVRGYISLWGFEPWFQRKQ